MLLYHRGDCPFCWKVRLAAAFRGISCEFVDVPRGTKHPEVLRLSTSGTVPVMVDGDNIFGQSDQMLRYLDQNYFGPALFPTDPAVIGPFEVALAFSDQEFGKSIFPIATEMRRSNHAERNLEIMEEARRLFDVHLAFLFEFAGLLQASSPRALDMALFARFAIARSVGLFSNPSSKHAVFVDWYAQMCASRPVQDDAAQFNLII
jgi:RNA polymerase-associated protein